MTVPVNTPVNWGNLSQPVAVGPTPVPNEPTLQGGENLWNVKTFGARGDGVTDDSAAILAAENAAVAAGGGVVEFPAGTFRGQNLIKSSLTHWRGAGISATTIKLVDGANCDLIQTSGAPALHGTNSTGGVYNWGLSNLTLDGNKANNASGYGLNIYGYGYVLLNLRVRNCAFEGIYSEWSTSANPPTPDSMEAQWVNVKVHDCGLRGIYFNGPHDSQLVNVVSYNTFSHNLHLGPNATGTQLTNFHGYLSTNGQKSLAILNEAGSCRFWNCVAEGSDTVQVAMLAGNFFWSGQVFANNIAGASGIQIGQQAGLTPYYGSTLQSGGLTTAVAPAGYVIEGVLQNLPGANGVLWFANDGGNGLVLASIFGTSGNWRGGNPAANTTWLVNINGLAGNFNQSISNPGMLSTKQSTSAASLATGGTISLSGGLSVVRVTTTGAVTGAILGTGSVPGQVVTIINESANSITFAASGSNVADAASDVISATSARQFVWDSGTSLWYRCG